MAPVLKQPRIAAEIRIPSERVRQWFLGALGKDDPKPTLAACEKLAREFQSILNRRNTEEQDIDPTEPDWTFKDDIQKGWEQKRREKFRQSACRLLVEAEELEGVFGSEPFGIDRPSLDEIRKPLLEIGALPVVHEQRPKRGRPPEAWHLTGHLIADAIKAALAECKFRGSTSKQNADSPVAVVGASLICSAYEIDVSADAFAWAMRQRHRTKFRTPDLDEFLRRLTPMRELGDDEARVTRDPSWKEDDDADAIPPDGIGHQEPQRRARDGFWICLAGETVDRLDRLRRPGEGYRETIERLTQDAVNAVTGERREN